MFRPIHNARSEEIRKTLATVFPRMSWYDEGMFTIVTDSIPPVVQGYRLAIRELATDWYLTFHPLTRNRRPQVQQYMVIFDDWPSYIDYAFSDGVPGWVSVGYFQPQSQVLYTFNMVGQWFSELLEEAFLSDIRGARDRVTEDLKGHRYEAFIKGQLSEFLQRYETTHATLRQMYRQESIDTLRHELTHAMFHNWGLQMIVLSRVPEADEETAKKKRQYLEAADPQQKRQILEELLDTKKEKGLPEMQAANSWAVEGLAGFMEPTPVGALLVSRLESLEEARRNGQMLPLEFLNVFKIGSFRGMTTHSKMYAYAQSWALVHFLMQRYPEGFLAYLDRVAGEQPQDDEDTLEWLLEAVGQDQRSLEREFLAHVEAFPHEDPLWLKQMQMFLDLRQELLHQLHVVLRY
jgi:hypothetical protein